jgi:hypothetical protein
MGKRRRYPASVIPVRTASGLARSIAAALFALLLALRLLTPEGFMPAFEHGAVTIVACPDADPAAVPPMAAHHHGSKKVDQPCPYASTSGLGSVAPDLPLLVGALLLSSALLLGRTFLFLERSRAYERPPLRGPPIPA